MLDANELSNAVELQQRVYLLLKWLNSAIYKGFVSIDSIHKYATDSKIAAEWIYKHYKDLPNEARPPKQYSDDINLYVNMFLSYLSTSFDIVDNPGERYIPHGRRTTQSAYAANAYFRAKKLTKKDKIRAQKLKVNYLKQLALDEDIILSEKVIDKMIKQIFFCKF